MSKKDDEEKDSGLWKSAIGRALGVDEDKVEERLSSMSLPESLQLAKELATRLGLGTGSALATLQKVFPDARFEEYNETDYTTLCRGWDDDNIQFTSSDAVKLVYHATRSAALDPKNSPSTSASTTTINNLSPVLLTGRTTNAVAEEAHLCPSTGKTFKCDTWLYVAAAVLGMAWEGREDRDCLIRAIRGSYPPAATDEAALKGDTEDEKKNSKEKRKVTMEYTGINRCPFNLVAFASQKNWFDVRSGVMILPCMTMDEAKDWKGGPYSVIVLCNDGKATRESKCTAEEIANQIRLPTAELQDAGEDDIKKAHAILKQAIKACAFVLESKPGPNSGPARGKWDLYRESLASVRGGARMYHDDIPDHSVAVPTTWNKPADRMVAKIDLAKCLSSGLQEGNSIAYPDPMLLVFKTSVNWTREHHFQLIAEAEPVVPDMDLSHLGEVYVPYDDKSTVSALSAKTLPSR